MRKYTDLQKEWQKKSSFLGEISLPDSLAWSDEHVPQARAKIENTYKELTKAMVEENGLIFDTRLKTYVNMWLRLWQLQALDHFKTRDILDVDMRFFRHLPDGYSMTWDSKRLGKKFKVYPRKPKKPPKGMEWLTAGEMIQIFENPAILDVMENFDGWMDRDEASADKALRKAMEANKKNPPKPKLKFKKRDKHGFEWFE